MKIVSLLMEQSEKEALQRVSCVQMEKYNDVAVITLNTPGQAGVAKLS